jgi:hypothetical protein
MNTWIPLDMVWKQEDGKLSERLCDIISPLETLPYSRMNCATFIVFILNSLCGETRFPIDEVPEKIEKATFRDWLNFFRAFRIKKNESIIANPGDLIFTGPYAEPLNHFMIVGWKRNTLWHSTEGPGVHYTGFGFLSGQQSSYSCYRPHKIL